MTKLTKTLLFLSIVLLGGGVVLVSGLIDVHNAVAAYVTLPAGAIFLGLFLVSKLLEKEMASYDEEQRALISTVTRPAQTNTASAARPCCAGDSGAKPVSKAA